MAALSQCRTLSGVRAFTGVRPRAVALVSNGVKYEMRKKDSYMVEVNVGEDEPEDIAVRKFMKKIVDSKLIEQLRARRYKETPREELKRRLRERIFARKNRIMVPTWEEENGPVEASPFQGFFSPENDGPLLDDGMGYGNEEMFINNQANQWGGYINDPKGGYAQGGYMAGSAGFEQQGGYMQQPDTQQASFDAQQQGTYIAPQ